MVLLREPSNDAILRYLFPQNKSQTCLLKLDNDRNSTRVKHTYQTHHRNTIWPLVHHQQPLKGYLEYGSKRSSTPGNSAWLGLRLSGGRSCFFVTDKGEKLVQFGIFDPLWYGCGGQFLN